MGKIVEKPVVYDVDRFMDVVISRYALRYNLSYEELRQESWLQFSKIRGKFDPYAYGARTYIIYTVMWTARNLLRNCIKHSYEVPEECSKDHISSRSLDNELTYRKTLEKVMRVLPENERRAVELVYGLADDHKGEHINTEVARIMGLSKQRIGQLLKKAFKRLRCNTNQKTFKQYTLGEL